MSEEGVPQNGVAAGTVAKPDMGLIRLIRGVLEVVYQVVCRRAWGGASMNHSSILLLVSHYVPSFRYYTILVICYQKIKKTRRHSWG